MEHQPVGITDSIPKNLFITFEGSDGAGKTAHADAAQKVLNTHGMQTLRTREPAGTEIGDQIREHVLRSGGYIDPQAEALLFAADRAQNINTHVAPALARGVTVLQERYIDSSVAWTEASQILNPREVRDLGLWAASGLLPDLTILLDIPAEIIVRLLGIPDGPAASEQLEFHRHIRASFLKIARREPQRFLIVDTEQPFEDAAAAVAAEIIRRTTS
jgi:dTMP kinase